MELEALSFQDYPRTHAVLEAGVREGVAPGFVAGFWSVRDRRARAMAVGQRRLEPSAQPLSVDTVYDLASVTKVMGTAALAARLVDRGWIDWETPLPALLPGSPDREVRLVHLLSHTAGYVAWVPLWERIRARFSGRELHRVSVVERQRAMREEVLSIRPEAAPGERCVYSDISFLLLGFALEEVTGLPLDRAVARWVWNPLGIEGAYYSRTTRAPSAIDDEVAATERCLWRGAVLQGQVHDDNCWSMGGYAGHAGAFGPISSVLEFGARCLSGAFSPAVQQKMWSPVARPSGCRRTPGWDMPSGDLPSLGSRFSPDSVGHLGFTGTSLWIDPTRGLAVSLLSNRVHPSRDNQAIRQLRPRFHDALAEDLGIR
jgi:CubicO group peptidase (beta-lactamase class C family)